MIERVESDLISSNVFVVGNDKFCFIVDAGVRVEKVAEVVAGRTVEAVLLTHGHFDHCCRVEEYIQKFGAKVYASARIGEYLLDADKNYSEGKFALLNLNGIEFLKEDEGVLTLPHFKIFFKQLGGHSKSDMMFDFQGDIFVGDVVIGRDMGRIDLYGGDKDEMKNSLAFLKDYQYNMMHSGHGMDNSKETQDKVVSLWLKFLDR